MCVCEGGGEGVPQRASGGGVQGGWRGPGGGVQRDPAGDGGAKGGWRRAAVQRWEHLQSLLHQGLSAGSRTVRGLHLSTHRVVW